MTAPQGKEVFTPLVTNAAKIAALETEVRRLGREAEELRRVASAWGGQAIRERVRAKAWRAVAILAPLVVFFGPELLAFGEWLLEAFLAPTRDR